MPVTKINKYYLTHNKFCFILSPTSTNRGNKMDVKQAVKQIIFLARDCNAPSSMIKEMLIKYGMTSADIEQSFYLARQTLVAGK
jgi:hypothetical protein